MILQLVWLAAIAHLRSPAGRARKDRPARWNEVYDIYDAMDWPTFPVGLRGGM